MEIRKISVLGAGNGGVTAAADLSQRGFDVRLYELPAFKQNLVPIEQKGGVLLKTDESEQFISLSDITSDIKEAIEGTDLIILVVPAIAVEEFARQCAPYLEQSHTVLINGASAMSSLRFLKVVRAMGNNNFLKIGETASLTYGTRVSKKGEVELYLKAKKILFSAYPESNTESILKLCKQVYDCLVPASNVWEVTLNNGNPESHPAPSLLNAGRIEYSKGEFFLYKEGITESVSKLIKAVSRERAALCKEMGVKYIPPQQRLVEIGYSEPYDHLHEQYNFSKVFTSIKGPMNLHSRYFIEDISMGLVLWSSLGKSLNCPTPIIDSIIELSGALLGRNFWEEGLTIDKLGLSVGKGLLQTEMKPNLA